MLMSVFDPRTSTAYDWGAHMSETELALLVQSAEAGDPDAQFSLGVRCAVGDGVTQDLPQARTWYGLAAEQGHPEAAFNLAAMWLHGEGGSRRVENANAAFARASELGSPDASVWLGETRLEAGDFTAAIGFFRRALDQGDLRGLREIAMILKADHCPLEKSEIGNPLWRK